MGVQYLRDLDVLEVDVWPLLPRMRIQSWDRGMEVLVLVGDSWRPARTSRGVLLLPEASRENAFIETIPRRALELSLDCGAHQLAALRLLRSYPEMSELSITPNFLWLIARRLDARRLDEDAVHAILSRRRRELLSWCLGVDVPPSAVRLLGKISLPDRSERSYRLLRRALSNAGARRVLGHLKRITLEQISLVLRNPALARLPCFVEGLTPPYPGLPDVVTMHRRTIGLGIRLGIRNAAAMVRAARYDDLLEMYVRWSTRFDERHALDDLVARYGEALPLPPFPGNDDIVPLVTASDLIEESSEMHHCVLSFAEWAYRGACAIYRVLRPHRATLMLKLPSAEIMEFSGPANTLVPPECWEAVESWVAEAQSAQSTRR